MALFVQLESKGVQTWHVVESFETFEEAANSSLDFKRSYTCGCGLKQVASAHLLAEADAPPWTNRHVAKGCFKTASDPSASLRTERTP